MRKKLAIVLFLSMVLNCLFIFLLINRSNQTSNAPVGDYELKNMMKEIEDLSNRPNLQYDIRTKEPIHGF